MTHAFPPRRSADLITSGCSQSEHTTAWAKPMDRAWALRDFPSCRMASFMAARAGLASCSNRSSTEEGTDSALPWKDITSTASATVRSEEHTSELQSLMRISYAVFGLKQKTH